jgi:poly(A) polymerase
LRHTALKIVKKLQASGYKAYYAGGAVRDLIRGKHPEDYDIATSARPEEIESLLNKTIPIGKQFGVILVIENGHQFEIATFRSDSAIYDGRRPDAVYFTNAKEDALRRDFTINGIFYDPVKKEYLDFVGGQDDIQKGLIRFIGNGERRIKEDHLRVLRAVRFKNRIGFQYGPRSKKALKEFGFLITSIAPERLGEELYKILVHHSRDQALRDLSKLGILKYVLPEVENLRGVPQPKAYHQEGDVFEHTVRAIKNLPNNQKLDRALIFATLLHDIAKPHTFSHQDGERIRFDDHAEKSARLAARICRRLKFSKLEVTKITWLIEHHMMMLTIPQMREAHRHRLFNHYWFEDLLILHKADEMGSEPVDLSLYQKLKKMHRQSKRLMLPEADLISGKEIIERFQLEAGPMIGQLKEEAHNLQIEGMDREEVWERLGRLIVKD